MYRGAGMYGVSRKFAMLLVLFVSLGNFVNAFCEAISGI